jgi:hypothetical protein
LAKRRLLPKDFALPTTSWKDAFRIRPLTIDDVVKDFACYMSCVDFLRTGGFIQPPDMPFIDFPRHDTTLRWALILLGHAEYLMANGERVEFGLFDAAEKEEFGCIYVLPTRKEGFDAEVTFWVRQDHYEVLDAELYEFLQHWVPKAFPMLRSVLFPGRQMSWSAWSALPNARAPQ